MTLKKVWSNICTCSCGLQGPYVVVYKDHELSVVYKDQPKCGLQGPKTYGLQGPVVYKDQNFMVVYKDQKTQGLQGPVVYKDQTSRWSTRTK